MPGSKEATERPQGPPAASVHPVVRIGLQSQPKFIGLDKLIGDQVFPKLTFVLSEVRHRARTQEHMVKYLGANVVAGLDGDQKPVCAGGRPHHLPWSPRNPTEVSLPPDFRKERERGTMAEPVPTVAMVAKEYRPFGVGKAGPKGGNKGPHGTKHRLPRNELFGGSAHLTLQPGGKAISRVGGVFEVQLKSGAGPVRIREVRFRPFAMAGNRDHRPSVVLPKEGARGIQSREAHSHDQDAVPCVYPLERVGLVGTAYKSRISENSAQPGWDRRRGVTRGEYHVLGGELLARDEAYRKPRGCAGDPHGFFSTDPQAHLGPLHRLRESGLEVVSIESAGEQRVPMRWNPPREGILNKIFRLVRKKGHAAGRNIEDVGRVGGIVGDPTSE